MFPSNAKLLVTQEKCPLKVYFLCAEIWSPCHLVTEF